MTQEASNRRARKSQALKTAVALIEALPPPPILEEKKRIERAVHDHRTSVYRLTRSYDLFNLKFFGGRLPQFNVADAETGTSAETRFKDKLILLSPASRNDPRERRRELLHEMCHVAAGARAHGHGPRWKEQMRHLADVGEVWARKEAEDYPTQLRRLHERMRPV